MLLLDESTIVVSSAEELAEAAGPGNDYGYIYLEGHIQIPPEGITIDPEKPSLVIDGLYGGDFAALEDADSLSEQGTIGIRASSSIELHFQNLMLRGRNPFGMPYISGAADTESVALFYENVIYEGPRITYHPKGLTRYKDCDIHIAYPEEEERSRGAGEVNRVELDGSCVFSHAGAEKALFSFRGDPGSASCKVLPDAHVTVGTEGYFMDSLSPGTPPRHIPVAYEIEAGASLILTAGRGISCGQEHRASSFLLAAGASFRYSQQTAQSGAASLYINGAFTVEEDATLYMEADFPDARPLLCCMERRGALNVRKPKSFVLYNRSASVLTVGADGIAKAFSFTTRQLNQWETASPLPDAGGSGDIPDAKWHKANGSDFIIEGSLSSLSTHTDYTTFSPEELADLPDPGVFSFQNARVLSLGSLSITPSLCADDGRPLFGFTEPGAALEIRYTVEGGEYYYAADTGVNGSYMIFTQSAIPAGTLVTIQAATPFLLSTVDAAVIAVVGAIALRRRPVRIAFALPPLSTEPDVILGRVNPTEAVEVLDNRSAGSPWKLTVSVAEPLKTIRGQVSANALVFKDNDGVLHELGPEPTVVYESDFVPGQTNIIWPADRGILVRVEEAMHAGVEYTTELLWALRD